MTVIMTSAGVLTAGGRNCKVAAKSNHFLLSNTASFVHSARLVLLYLGFIVIICVTAPQMHFQLDVKCLILINIFTKRSLKNLSADWLFLVN